MADPALAPAPPPPSALSPCPPVTAPCPSPPAAALAASLDTLAPQDRQPHTTLLQPTGQLHLHLAQQEVVQQLQLLWAHRAV